MRYHVTWLETYCMGAYIEADTPEEAAEAARSTPNIELGAETLEVGPIGDICVNDGHEIHSEEA